MCSLPPGARRRGASGGGRRPERVRNMCIPAACRRGCVTPLWNDCPPQRATGPSLGGPGSAAALVPQSLQFGNGDGIKGVVYSVFTAGNSILNDVILRCWDALFGCFHEGFHEGFHWVIAILSLSRSPQQNLFANRGFVRKVQGGQGRPAAVPCRRPFRATSLFGFRTRFGKGISGKP